MADAVLLEWEGVLADTRAARRDALRRALAAEGVAHTLSDDDEQLRGLGLGAAVRTVMRHMGCVDATLADLLVMRAGRAFAETLAAGLVLAPGAAPFVARLQARTRLAIVTRASRAETEQMLRMAGLEDAVSAVVTADDVSVESPATDGYRAALHRLSRLRAVQPSEAVAVVDAAPAIRAARGAGTRVVAVCALAHHAIEADAAVDGLDDASLDEWILARPAPGQRGTS